MKVFSLPRERIQIVGPGKTLEPLRPLVTGNERIRRVASPVSLEALASFQKCQGLEGVWRFG